MEKESKRMNREIGYSIEEGVNRSPNSKRIPQCRIGSEEINKTNNAGESGDVPNVLIRKRN